MTICVSNKIHLIYLCEMVGAEKRSAKQRGVKKSNVISAFA